MLNIAVLVSGGGTNLQALLDSEARGENPDGKITLVVASKPGVYALERAAKAGVEGVVVRRPLQIVHLILNLMEFLPSKTFPQFLFYYPHLLHVHKQLVYIHVLLMLKLQIILLVQDL